MSEKKEAANPGTALTPYAKVDNPIAFVESMGESCAAMVGASPTQGRAIAMACLCQGMDPFEFQRTYHWIQGKPAKKYDAMLAEYRRMGGEYTIVERSADRAAIHFEHLGQSTDVEYTWEQAQQDRWPWKNWQDHNRGLKDNWSTPSDRRTMLFARLVSDTLRVLAPEIVHGIYTPEEVMDFEGNGQVGQAAPKKSALDAAREAAAKAKVSTASVTTNESVADDAAEAAVEVDDTNGWNPASGDAAETVGITEAQQSLILALYEQLEIPEGNQKQALERRGVEELDELTREQAQSIIDKLESLKKQGYSAGN